MQVAVLPFATPFQLRKELDQVAEWILTLTSADKQQDNTKSNLKLARYTSKNEDISNAIKQDNQAELASLLKEGSRVRIYLLLQLLNY